MIPLAGFTRYPRKKVLSKTGLSKKSAEQNEAERDIQFRRSGANPRFLGLGAVTGAPEGRVNVKGMPFRLAGSNILAVWRGTAAANPGASQDRVEDEVVDLFDRFRGPLLRYLSSFGLAPADGEEIVQDVFLLLYRHLQRGKSRENLRGWLFRVAHNLALKRRYRTRREFGMTEASAEELALDPNPSPEAQLAASQDQQRLRAVVRALPELDRRCLFLRAEGLRYREIAAILEISLGAVSGSLARSLARISRVAER